MNLDSLRAYCLNKPDVTEDTPFDETTLVFRINRKIFLLTDMEYIPFRFNLKAVPEEIPDLIENYSCIGPGYHMNKKHWITIVPDSSVSDSFIRKLIDISYDLVKAGTKKKKNY